MVLKGGVLENKNKMRHGGVGGFFGKGE